MLSRDRFDVSIPPNPRLGAVLLHPHPSYGGDRHNIVVQAVYDALPPAAIASVRFDFASDDLDRGAADAIDAMALLPPNLPVAVVGYSFGAVVASQVVDDLVAGWTLVAPPFGSMLPGSGRPIGKEVRPKLVLAAAHDQFCPPETARREVSSWLATDVEDVPGADHFLTGATASVASRVCTWLSRLVPAER